MSQTSNNLAVFMIGFAVFLSSVRMLQLGVDTYRNRSLRRVTSISYTLMSPVMAVCGMWLMITGAF